MILQWIAQKYDLDEQEFELKFNKELDDIQDF